MWEWVVGEVVAGAWRSGVKRRSGWYGVCQEWEWRWEWVFGGCGKELVVKGCGCWWGPSMPVGQGCVDGWQYHPMGGDLAWELPVGGLNLYQ